MPGIGAGWWSNRTMPSRPRKYRSSKTKNCYFSQQKRGKNVEKLFKLKMYAHQRPSQTVWRRHSTQAMDRHCMLRAGQLRHSRRRCADKIIAKFDSYLGNCWTGARARVFTQKAIGISRRWKGEVHIVEPHKYVNYSILLFVVIPTFPYFSFAKSNWKPKPSLSCCAAYGFGKVYHSPADDAAHPAVGRSLFILYCCVYANCRFITKVE